MTYKEFNETPVSVKTKVRVSGITYKLYSVDYEDGLVYITTKTPDTVHPVSYIFCEFINEDK